MTFDNQDVLFWDDKFWVEVTPEFNVNVGEEITTSETEKPRKLSPNKKKRCGRCHKYGHTAWSCTEGHAKKAKDLEDDDEDEAPLRPEVTRDQVQELKDEGLDSVQVAARLKTTLKEVNKHWL